MLNYDVEANALGLPQFANMGQSGSHSVAIEGEVGRNVLTGTVQLILPKSKRLPQLQCIHRVPIILVQIMYR